MDAYFCTFVYAGLANAFTVTDSRILCVLMNFTPFNDVNTLWFCPALCRLICQFSQFMLIPHLRQTMERSRRFCLWSEKCSPCC